MTTIACQSGVNVCKSHKTAKDKHRKHKSSKPEVGKYKKFLFFPFLVSNPQFNYHPLVPHFYAQKYFPWSVNSINLLQIGKNRCLQITMFLTKVSHASSLVHHKSTWIYWNSHFIICLYFCSKQNSIRSI